MLRAVFLDPGKRSSVATVTHVMPSALKTASAFHHSLSGLDHTARVLAVYASQLGSLRVHARLAYDGCHAVAGIGYPVGLIEGFDSFSVHLVPPQAS